MLGYNGMGTLNSTQINTMIVIGVGLLVGKYRLVSRACGSRVWSIAHPSLLCSKNLDPS
jgi:hypothetical protein